MKIDLTDLSPVKKSMVVEVDVAEVERETDQVLRRYRQQARIPGFRPGKAPLPVVRARFAREVEDDVRDRVISRSYVEAAREKGLRPLGDPVVEELNHEQGMPLRFKTTFEVLPEIHPKGYKNVEVRRRKADTSEAELERALEELRQSRARLVGEEGRAAAAGDVVLADLAGHPEGAEPFRRERMMIEVGAQDNLPAFNERLVGVKAGAELEFPIDYPPDYRLPALAGRTVRYRLKLHEVKRREVPELDDEFAKDLGDFESLTALRARLRQDLQARKEHEAEQELRRSLVDKVLLENPVVLPDVLVDQEIRHRLEEIVRGMVLQGVDPQKVDIDWKELRQRQEEPARKAVHARLILDAVARAESLSVDEQECEERIRRDARLAGESYDKLRARFKTDAGLEAVRTQLVREKSLDYLTSVANIHVGE